MLYINRNLCYYRLYNLLSINKGIIMNIDLNPTNDNQLLVEVKKIYGVDRVYPACSKSLALSKLIGKKTFSKQEVNIIREELGYILKHKTYEV